MLAKNRNLQSAPRHSYRGLFFALSTAAVATLLIACGGGSSSGSSNASAANSPSGASSGGGASDAKTAAGHNVCPPSEASKDLTGAGSSAVFPLVSKWVDDYQKQCGVKLNYQS